MSERENQIHCARVYLAQSRARGNSGFAFLLLEWAAKCRLSAYHIPQTGKMVEQNHIADTSKMVGKDHIAGTGKVIGQNHIEDSRGMVGQMELFA